MPTGSAGEPKIHRCFLHNSRSCTHAVSKLWKQGISLDLHRPLIYARMPNFRQSPASPGTQYHTSCVNIPAPATSAFEPRRTSRLPMDPVKVNVPWLERDCCFAMLPFLTSAVFLSSPDRPMHEHGKIAGVICLSTVGGSFRWSIGASSRSSISMGFVRFSSSRSSFSVSHQTPPTTLVHSSTPVVRRFIDFWLASLICLCSSVLHYTITTCARSLTTNLIWTFFQSILQRSHSCYGRTTFTMLDRHFEEMTIRANARQYPQ